MGHNIEIRNGQASMFYVDEPPWHSLGKKLAKPATAREAIEAAKLDWEVMKVPLYVERGNSRITVEDTLSGLRTHGTCTTVCAGRRACWGSSTRDSRTLRRRSAQWPKSRWEPADSRSI